MVKVLYLAEDSSAECCTLWEVKFVILCCLFIVIRNKQGRLVSEMENSPVPQMYLRCFTVRYTWRYIDTYFHFIPCFTLAPSSNSSTARLLLFYGIMLNLLITALIPLLLHTNSFSSLTASYSFLLVMSPLTFLLLQIVHFFLADHTKHPPWSHQGYKAILVQILSQYPRFQKFL